MNLGELRTLLSRKLNFNTGQTDQDFGGTSVDANKDLDDYLNEAYRDIVSYARVFIRREAFQDFFDVTWPADAATLAIPTALRDAPIIGIRDDTDLDTGNPGAFLSLRNQFAGEVDSIYVLDRLTWAWWPAPSAAKTLKVFHLGAPVRMQDASDVPDLIPDVHHELLVWEAAVIGLAESDHQAPSKWEGIIEKKRGTLWKEIGVGRPMLAPPPHIRHTDPYR